MWVFLATVCLGFSTLLGVALVSSVAGGELHQYSRRAGFLVRVVATDATGFWLEVAVLALVAFFLMGVGLFAFCAYVVLGRKA
jgi:uncharacterized membrane protein